nr:Chain A, Nuclear pore complex protein Nup98-Nup96 [Homo sapiens]6BZM_B Chain B, Nuclear pore complex protein Nup98-Nup96 [Homo sapiens]
GFGNFGTS